MICGVLPAVACGGRYVFILPVAKHCKTTWPVGSLAWMYANV